VEKYIQFLQLFRKFHPHKNGIQPMPLVPTNQLDLIWHTHMLKSPQLYNSDCLRIAGMKIHHDDSFNDRTEGGMLEQSFQATSQLWKETYGEDYAVCGGMYRGEPPEEYWDPNWVEQAKRLLSEVPLKWLPACTLFLWERQPTFIPAQAKSRRVGVNNNE
jgi:Glycine-rich domain-containing protein-like